MNIFDDEFCSMAEFRRVSSAGEGFEAGRMLCSGLKEWLWGERCDFGERKLKSVVTSKCHKKE